MISPSFKPTARAREIRVGQLPALHDNAAREFEDGIGPRVGPLAWIASSISARFSPIIAAMVVCALKQVAAQVALGDR
jgi:hypothetical protein